MSGGLISSLIAGALFGAIATTVSLVKNQNNKNKNADDKSKDKKPIDGWKCPICGKSNERFTKVCSSCKYDVKPDGWVCPICGEINEKETSTCKCGYEDF